MSKYANIEQIKEVIRTEWVRYMPMELDISLSFVLGKISEVPTIDIVICKDCRWSDTNNEGDYDCKRHIPTFRVPKDGFCNFGEKIEDLL